VDILHESPTWQANALLEAGKVYEQLNQPTDAADLYERLVERFPKEAAATEARNRLGAVKSTASSKEARPAS
jgi:TolA-binding protein